MQKNYLLSVISISLIYISSFVLGDVGMSTPKYGAVYSATAGSATIPVKWVDDTNYPTLDKITYYTISLCYGPNYEIDCFYTIGDQLTPEQLATSSGSNEAYSYDAVVPSTAAGNGQFYIQIYAVVQGQGNTIHYSPRFSLSGMTGPATFVYSDTTQPPAQTSINTNANNNDAAQTTIDSASFSVTYTKQTGKTRYAPMQMQPGSKVTATTWKRKYATSAVTYYKTARASLQQLSTITPGRSYQLTSDFNYATPAPMPSDNGGWYEPKQRMSLSVRKINI